MDNSLISHVNTSNSLLILLPVKPYFDQVAAGLSLYLAFRDKKQVVIACPTPMTVEFNRLTGVDKIKTELGNKNLVIKFINYEGKNIERVSADIADGLFQLTVIPKEDIPPPQTEHIETSYSGSAFDTVILVGGTNEVHFPYLSENENLPNHILHVGIRPLSFSRETKMVSFVKDVSSVSEIVATLLMPTEDLEKNDRDQTIEGNMVIVEADGATNLLAGIETNTDYFSASSVSADTFFVVSKLMRLGAVRGHNKNMSLKNFPPGSIPGDQPQRNIDTQNQNVQTAPRDWFGKPKIYKGAASS